MQTSISPEARASWIFAGTYFAACYVASLRGSEGLLMELAGLQENFETYETRSGHFLSSSWKSQGQAPCVSSSLASRQRNEVGHPDAEVEPKNFSCKPQG